MAFIADIHKSHIVVCVGIVSLAKDHFTAAGLGAAYNIAVGLIAGMLETDVHFRIASSGNEDGITGFCYVSCLLYGFERCRQCSVAVSGWRYVKASGFAGRCST